MSDHEEDIKADIFADMPVTPNGPVEDAGETISAMEPIVLGEGAKGRGELTDLAIELAQKSAAFTASLPDGVRDSLADLVRNMNCYYSNLIEGHRTHPIEIERAMAGDYSDVPEKRNLQLEARAHVKVQSWIDAGGLTDGGLSAKSLREIHYRFCSEVPDELLWVKDPETGEKHRVVPGELRTRHVRAGRHIAISPGAVPRFLDRFESAYSGLGRTDAILSIAAAHHRFAWIHPFLDGNGRVARLLSHAMLRDQLASEGLWSVSRGLARSVASYKDHMAACDMVRRNELDGRGNLSEEALVAMSDYFLRTCIDQVDFMKNLVRPEMLRNRILSWSREQMQLGDLPANCDTILEAMLYKGELQRPEIARLIGTGVRQARRVVSMLMEKGVLVSASAKSPLRLAFPARLADRWMPGLFPEA